MQKTDGHEENGEYGLYEVGFHLVPTIAEDALQGVAGQISNVLTNHAARVRSSEGPTLRGLTYQMEKHIGGRNYRYDTAYFGSIVFEAAYQAVPEIQKDLEKTPEILRFVISRTSEEALMPRERKVTGRIEPEKFRPTEKAAALSATPISEEELDKTIEGLVVE